MRRAIKWSLAAAALVVPFVLVLVARYARRPSEAECHARVQAFRAWEDSLPEDYIADSKVVAALATVPRAQYASIQRAPLLVIWPSRIELDGSLLAGAPALREGLREKARNIRQDNALLGNTEFDGFNGIIHVAVTRDARWSDVIGVLAVARQEGFRNINYVFARPGPRPPDISDFDQAWLDRLKDPSSLLTRALEKQPEVLAAVTPRCSAMGILFQRAIDSRRYDKVQALWSRLEDCRCAPDVEVLKAWQARWVPPGGIDWAVFVGGYATIGDDPKLRVIAYPADAKWEQIAGPFMAVIKTENGAPPEVRLELKP